MRPALPGARKGVIRTSAIRPATLTAAVLRPARSRGARSRPALSRSALARLAVIAAIAVAGWWTAALAPAALARGAADATPIAGGPALVGGAVRVSLAGPGDAARPAASARVSRQARLQARAILRLLRQDRAAWAKCTSPACRAALPAIRDLSLTQQLQARGYYCGPATVAEMLAQLGRRVSQGAAARELGTGPAGTGWTDGSRYPVPDVLNANQAKNTYVPVALAEQPDRAQLREFEADLVADLNHGGGVPLAGNAYEVAGGPHLAGHPVNQTIFHWIDIRGYQDFGAVTDYEDSVHGAPSIGWSSGVPAYSSLSTRAMVSILGGRGYAW
jgi:hypothetical protein